MTGRIRVATEAGGSSEVGCRRSTLNSGKTRRIAGLSSLYVFGAVRARTRKGPIKRGDDSERDGRCVCSVSCNR